MYDNEWLRLSRFYFMEYKRQVEDIIHEDSQYYFIVEAPHEAELEAHYPAAGVDGVKLAHCLGFEGERSLGEIAKDDTRISILNVSRVPLQETKDLDGKYKVLFESLDPFIRQGYLDFGNHENEDVNKFEQAILYDFRNRLLKTNCRMKKATIVAWGEFAKTYVEQMKEELLDCEMVYVSEWNEGLELKIR